MTHRMTQFGWCALVALAACSGAATVPIDHTGAQLTVLNATSASDAVALKLDGASVTFPAAGAATSADVIAGSHRLDALGSGGQVLATTTFSVSGTAHHTAVLSGNASVVSLLVSAIDTAQVPLVDAIKARVVHTVATAPAMDVYFFAGSAPTDSASRFITNFHYGTGTNPDFPGYAVRPPGAYYLWFKAAGTSTVLLQAGPIALSAGHVYSFVLADKAGGGMELRTVVEQ
jgi:hypothetical protein